jgi:hypothetical protein
MDAIQAARQYTRDSRFSGTTLSRKDVTMRDPLIFDRIREGFLNVLLSD